MTVSFPRQTLKMNAPADDRSLQRCVEQEPAIVIVDIQVAVAGLQRDRFIDLVLKGAEQLPIEVGADPETADITLGAESEAAAKLDPAGHADERIDPGLAGAALANGKRTGQRQVRVQHPNA